MYVVAYYIVLAMRTTIVNSKNKDSVLLFYIGMHDPTTCIYLSDLNAKW